MTQRKGEFRKKKKDLGAWRLSRGVSQSVVSPVHDAFGGCALRAREDRNRLPFSPTLTIKQLSKQQQSQQIGYRRCSCGERHKQEMNPWGALGKVRNNLDCCLYRCCHWCADDVIGLLMMRMISVTSDV